MKFDPTKPVQTRDGRPARILATDANIPSDEDTDTIVALVTVGQGEEVMRSFQANGHYMWRDEEDKNDLINVPEPTREEVAYVNLGQSYSIPEPAAAASPGWPVLKVTLKVPEGDINLTNVNEVLSTEVVDGA